MDFYLATLYQLEHYLTFMKSVTEGKQWEDKVNRKTNTNKTWLSGKLTGDLCANQ
jgi:hypothetical protein